MKVIVKKTDLKQGFYQDLKLECQMRVFEKLTSVVRVIVYLGNISMTQVQYYGSETRIGTTLTGDRDIAVR